MSFKCEALPGGGKRGLEASRKPGDNEANARVFTSWRHSERQGVSSPEGGRELCGLGSPPREWVFSEGQVTGPQAAHGGPPPLFDSGEGPFFNTLSLKKNYFQ